QKPNIYRDANNAPDDNDLIYTDEIDVEFTSEDLAIRLPIDNLTLEPGRYWVSALAIAPISFARWNWIRRTPITDNEFHLIDREGFFDGVTPNTWLSGSALAAQLANNDLLFSIEGEVTESTEAPTELLVEQSGDEINISWADNSDSETGFSIERSTSSTSGFEEIGTTEADITEFVDSDFETNTRYFYRVRALSDVVNSAYAGPENILTLPQVPVLLDATNVDPDGFTINWDVTDGTRSFEVDISTDNFVTFVEGFENAVSISQSLDVTGLPPAGYQYRVRSVNTAGVSDYSETGNSVIVTGIQDQLISTFELKVFPNPVVDQLNLRIPNEIVGDVQTIIYDFRGRIVLKDEFKVDENNQILMNVSQLNLGVYVIVVQSKDEFSRTQFVKMN
ncbi:MAG: T9SS type A sorting domain-containing protein, partial [Bacteroidota bacterium]